MKILQNYIIMTEFNQISSISLVSGSSSSGCMAPLLIFLNSRLIDILPFSYLVIGIKHPQSISLLTRTIVGKSSLSPSSAKPVNLSTIYPFLKHKTVGKNTNFILLAKNYAFYAFIDKNLHSVC
jgi:hypothetical protein